MAITTKHVRSTPHHLSLLLLLTTLLLPHPSQSLDVDELCEIRCNIGRGGMLCKCNAFHFAGKRSRDSPSSLSWAAALNRGSRKYGNLDGGAAVSASGEEGEAKWRRSWDKEKEAAVMAADLLGDGGQQGRAAVTKGLASLLKRALKERLTSNRKQGLLKASNWQDESSFPFITVDEEEY